MKITSEMKNWAKIKIPLPERYCMSDLELFNAYHKAHPTPRRQLGKNGKVIYCHSAEKFEFYSQTFQEYQAKRVETLKADYLAKYPCQLDIDTRTIMILSYCCGQLIEVLNMADRKYRWSNSFKEGDDHCTH